jgi:hypothetical protein
VAPVDVVIPLYNAAPFVERTLRSVLAQTRLPQRVIVVDDGSTDGGPDVVRALVANYSGPVRIDLLEQPNAGPNTARNTGLQAGTSSFVAFLDADDLWAPTKLEEQLRVFSGDAKDDLLLVYCRAHWIDILDRPKQGTPLNEGEALRGHVFDRLLPRNRIWGGSSAVLIRREAFDLAGPFDVGLRAAEDFDMWLRIAKVEGWTWPTLIWSGSATTQRTPRKTAPTCLMTPAVLPQVVRQRQGPPGSDEGMGTPDRAFCAALRQCRRGRAHGRAKAEQGSAATVLPAHRRIAGPVHRAEACTCIVRPASPDKRSQCKRDGT